MGRRRIGEPGGKVAGAKGRARKKGQGRGFGLGESEARDLVPRGGRAGEEKRERAGSEKVGRRKSVGREREGRG